MSQPANATLPRPLRYTRQGYEFLRGLESPGTAGLLNSMGDPENLPEGPEVVPVQAAKADTASAVEQLLKKWKADGLCEPHEVILLHVRHGLSQTALGSIEELAGLPLVEATESDNVAAKRAIHLTSTARKASTPPPSSSWDSGLSRACQTPTSNLLTSWAPAGRSSSWGSWR